MLRTLFAAALPLALVLTSVVPVAAEPANEAPDFPEPYTVEDVVVTGTRTEKLLREVTVRTQLIDSDAISAMGAQNLADAVEFMPGVRVLNGCQNCNFTTLSLLGLEGKYSQVLFDSRPSFSGLSLVYGLEQIPAEMIDRIEIVKGGGSSIYGPGAVGGVVNIIPHDPHGNETHAHVRYADMDGSDLWSAGFGGSVTSEDGLSGMTFFGKANEADPYDRNGDGFTEVARLRSTAFGGRYVKNAGDFGRLTVDFGRLYEDRRGGNNLDDPPFDADIAEWIRSTRTTVSADWRDWLSEKTDYTVGVSYAHTRRQTYYGGGGDTGAFGISHNPLWVFDSQINHGLEKHLLSFGLQHRSDGLEDVHPAYDRMLDETYTNTGVFAQDDWTLADGVNLVFGARLDDHSELDDVVLSPRAALSWRPSSTTTFRGSFSTGFLAPQVFDEDLHITIAGGEGQVIRNDESLTEEKSRSFTLGFEATPRIGEGWGLFEVNVFHTALEDAFAVEERDDPATTQQTEFYRYNAGEAEVNGAEITVGYMQGRFEAQVGLVQQKGEYDEVQDFDSKDFFWLPETSGVARLYWRDPEAMSLFAGLRYFGEMSVPHEDGFIDERRLETTDTFLTLDLSATKTFDFGGEEIGLTLGGSNVTDAFQEDFDEGADRDAGYVYGPRRPRTWYAQVNYGF